MKILHIIPTLNKGGAERLSLDICNHLSKQPGVEVRLIILHAQIKYDISAYTFPIKHISARVHLSISGQHVLFVDELQKYIDDYAPHVIHSHLFEAEIVSRAVHYPHARWFSHCHDNMVQFRNFSIGTVTSRKLFTNYIERRFLLQQYLKNGGNTFLAISNNTANYFRSVVPPSVGTVEVFPNAIDYRRFFMPSSKKQSFADGVLRLVSVGSLLENKNHVFQIEVVKILVDRGVKITLNMVGDGVTRDKVMQKIKDCGVEAQVQLHGNVNNVEEYLWQSDIFIHSAFSEAFGLVLLEAMAAGLPVVSLDGGGNRDLIQNGKNGFLLTERNPILFADKHQEISQNLPQYVAMSEQAQTFAMDYDIQAYILKLLRLYQK